MTSQLYPLATMPHAARQLLYVDLMRELLAPQYESSAERSVNSTEDSGESADDCHIVMHMGVKYKTYY